MNNKYKIDFSNEVIDITIKRLINQTWKLIPMRENEEDWLKQTDTVLVEITGLDEIFLNNSILLQILSKLEGLKFIPNKDFSLYRKTVFEILSLLQEFAHKYAE